jgi:glycosyltransferase involved in cell wall biosynthesis
MTLDIIIPTCKTLDQVADQMGEAVRTAGLHDVRMIVTCNDGSAAANRNLGLDLSTSDPLVMMDDDIEGFPMFWARDLLNIWNAHPDFVMLSPQLMRPEGGYAWMKGPDGQLGMGPRPTEGVTILEKQMLLSACIMVGRNDIRFDENFKGSGYEDDAYSDDLRAWCPQGKWLLCHGVEVVHRNNMTGWEENREANRRYYEQRKARKAS